MLIDAASVQDLFDGVPDVVFFVKDVDGRYRHANLTLLRRLGLRRRDELVGRNVAELFPLGLAQGYASQDARVLAGETIDSQLEVHLFPDRAPGWCLTRKQPLLVENIVCGIVGISRDLTRPDAGDPTYERLRRVVDRMQSEYAEPLRIRTLAELVGLSLSQLDRHFRRVFRLSPQQMLIKQRIDAAMRLLEGGDAIAVIGQCCGFTDQSAFARQFKAVVGMTPRDYRSLQRSVADGVR